MASQVMVVKEDTDTVGFASVAASIESARIHRRAGFLFQNHYPSIQR